jgi:actin-related protein 10
MTTNPQAPSKRASTIIDPRPPIRSSSSSYIVGNTPHYSTTRRHSLYGTEDRIIIDPGSKLWKVGFSGEGKPRQIYNISRPGQDNTLWSLETPRNPEEREEADRILQYRLQDALRGVFFE